MNLIMLGKGSRTVTLVIVICLAAASYVLISNYDSGYHPDEGVWTALGKIYFQNFFIDRDWSYETWNAVQYKDFGTTNPVIGRYIIGASLFLTGAADTNTVFPGYELTEGLIWNDLMFLSPPIEALEAARLPMKWLGIFSTVLLFLLSRELTRSWLLALLAASMFILQQRVQTYSSMAMIDMPVLFFSLLTLLIAALFLARIAESERLKIIMFSIILGLVLGLALSTKLSALLTAATVASWGLVTVALTYIVPLSPIQTFPGRTIRAVRNDPRLFRSAVLAAIIIGLMVLLVFLLSNPFLHRNTLDNLDHILTFGQKVANYDFVPDYQRLNTPKMRLTVMMAMGPLGSGPLSGLFGRTTIDVFLVWLGLGLCAYQLLRRSMPIIAKREWLWAVLWILFTTAGVLIWTPFAWDRWYLPMTPIWAFLEGAGIYLILLVAWIVFRRVSKKGNLTYPVR